MIYHEKVLHNHFMPCHRKYSGQHNQCDIHAVHDGKVGCNSVEYTTTFIYSDWLYFVWHGININTIPRCLARKKNSFNIFPKTHAYMYIDIFQTLVRCFNNVLVKVICRQGCDHP